MKALGGAPRMLPAAVRGPRADFTARNVLFWGRNNTTASKLFRRHLQPHQHGSAVVRSHLSDSPPAALLRLRGSVRPRKPRPRLPAPQPDPPEPPGPAERPGRGLARPRSGGRSPPGEGAGAEGGQRLRRGQSPARRGACAHPPAACGVFRVSSVSEARCLPTCASLFAAVQKPWEAGGHRLGSPGGAEQSGGFLCRAFVSNEFGNVGGGSVKPPCSRLPPLRAELALGRSAPCRWPIPAGFKACLFGNDRVPLSALPAQPQRRMGRSWGRSGRPRGGREDPL